MASKGTTKTTVDIQDELLARAKRHAQHTGRPLRAVVEEGLRQVLSDTAPANATGYPTRALGSRAGGTPWRRTPGRTFEGLYTESPEPR